MRAILVPVKAFRQAKHRLSPVLDGAGRAALARRLAQTVVNVNGPENLFVACDDGEVADWATSAGAFVLWTLVSASPGRSKRAFPTSPTSDSNSRSSPTPTCRR